MNTNNNTTYQNNNTLGGNNMNNTLVIEELNFSEAIVTLGDICETTGIDFDTLSKIVCDTEKKLVRNGVDEDTIRHMFEFDDDDMYISGSGVNALLSNKFVEKIMYYKDMTLGEAVELIDNVVYLYIGDDVDYIDYEEYKNQYSGDKKITLSIDYIDELSKYFYDNVVLYYSRINKNKILKKLYSSVLKDYRNIIGYYCTCSKSKNEIQPLIDKLKERIKNLNNLRDAEFNF